MALGLLGPQHVAPSPPCGRVSLPSLGVQTAHARVSGAARSHLQKSPPGRAAVTLVWFGGVHLLPLGAIVSSWRATSLCLLSTLLQGDAWSCTLE